MVTDFIHPDQRFNLCPSGCGKVFRTVQSLRYHVRVCTWKRCWVCWVSLKDAATVESHYHQHLQALYQVHENYHRRCVVLSEADHENGHPTAASEPTITQVVENHQEVEANAKEVETTNEHRLVFSCYVCYGSFFTKEEVLQHWRETHAEKLRTCELCRVTFSSIQDRRQHWQAQHEGTLDREFWCCEEGCGTGFVHRQALVEHQKRKHGKKRRAPSLSFQLIGDISKTLSTSGELVYPCPSCKKELHRVLTLKVHVRSCAWKQCFFCQQPFKNRRVAKHHYDQYHTLVDNSNNPGGGEKEEEEEETVENQNLARDKEVTVDENHPIMGAEDNNQSLEEDMELEGYGTSVEDDTKEHGLLVCHRCDCPFDSQEKLSRHLERGKCVPLSWKKKPLVGNVEANHGQGLEVEALSTIEVENDNENGDLGEQEAIVEESENESYFSEDDPALESEMEAVMLCCQVCTKSFTTPQQLRRHKCSHWRQVLNPSAPVKKPFQCWICGRDFRRRGDLKKHQVRHEKEDRHPCPYCGQLFTTPEELEHHRQEEHTGEKPHACAQCGKAFPTAYQLKTHQRTHTGDKPFSCQHCDKAFSQSSHLKIHQRTHTGEKPYACDQCDKAFATAGKLKRHLPTHTGEKPFECDQCDKIFSHKDTLKTHQRTHTGEKPFECDVCGKVFKSNGELKTHQRTHTGEKPYPCGQCDKAFSDRGKLKRHQRTHTGEKPYPCDECDKAFSQRRNLKDHLRIHTGDKPYQCDQCGKAFARVGDLKPHQRTHTGEKPHKCDVCGKAFSQKTHLKRHQRTHTRERPYKCDQCDKVFATKSVLKVHQRTHTGDKSYACNQCDQAFTTTGNLKRHQRTQHGI